MVDQEQRSQQRLDIALLIVVEAVVAGGFAAAAVALAGIATATASSTTPRVDAFAPHATAVNHLLHRLAVIISVAPMAELGQASDALGPVQAVGMVFQIAEPLSWKRPRSWP